MRTRPDTGLFVVEWSKSACALHVQSLQRAMDASRRLFAENSPPPNDFTIVFVGDEETAWKTADQLRPVLRARFEAMGKAGS